jgi:hypothetical protein
MTMVVALCATAQAQVTFVDLGTAAPPDVLGAWEVAPFPNDWRGEEEVTSVPPPASSPVTGDLLFDQPLMHYQVNDGWDSWSHGYDGDVYHLDELLYGNELTLTLPEGTRAFYFYLQPNFLGELNFQVTSGPLSDPAIANVGIDGDAGARGFGFYTDGSDLETITIAGLDTWPDGFAVGEFGIEGSVDCTPEGGVGLALAAAGICGLVLLHRRVRT